MTPLLLLASAVVYPSQAFAQEQFFTQSGGRGLQNAKTNARLTKTETDVGALQAEMATVKPHAKAELGNCGNAGEKLRYDGNNWICESETDPTVKGFAKKDLPSCSGGSILGVTGGELGCVQSGFLSTEADPTVQAFAKAPLPSCGQDQVLSVAGGGTLTCLTDQKGLTRETDPNVHDFARSDIVTSLPNCSTNEMLTMTGGRLSCRVDQVGITVEKDPLVQDFARNDVGVPDLAACGANEILKSTTVGGKVVLSCVSAASGLSEALALGDLSDVNTTGAASNKVLMFQSGSWQPADELDPSVSNWAKTAMPTCGAGNVLSYNGSGFTCVPDVGSTADPLNLDELADVSVASATTGYFLKYNGSSWGPSIVQDFAQATLPTCAAGEVLSGDGSNLSCVSDAGGASDPLSLVELADVRNGVSSNLAPTTGQFLRWNGTKWAAVTDKISDTQTTGSWCRYDGNHLVCDRGAPQTCASGQVIEWNSGTNAFGCVSGTTALGLGTMAAQDANNVAITGGTVNGVVIGGTAPAAATFTSLSANSATVSSAVVQGNLQVQGNLLVSGSQTFDGVTFANGGIQVAGGLSGDSVTANAVSATNISGTVADLRTLRVTNGLQVSGTASFDSVDILGNQTIGGVLFANGGIQLSGDVTAGTVSATNISGTVADLRTLRVTGNQAVTGNTVLAGVSATNVSASGNMTVAGALTAASAGFGPVAVTSLANTGALTVSGTTRVEDLYVRGALYVSGTQTIDGVSFANGGVQATGTVTATSFSGSGAGLTGVPATGMVAAGVVGSVQFKGAANEISGSSNLTVTNASDRADLAVSGTVRIAGSGTETCGVGDYGKMRFVDVGGGVFRMQFCRP